MPPFIWLAKHSCQWRVFTTASLAGIHGGAGPNEAIEELHRVY